MIQKQLGDKYNTYLDHAYDEVNIIIRISGYSSFGHNNNVDKKKKRRNGGKQRNRFFKK